MNQFYKSNKWRQKRESVLRRDEYMCRECKRYGRTTLTTTVHHIYPLELRPELALVSENLISLCNDHHEKMHDRTNNVLSALGMDWMRRIEEKISPPL